MPTTCVRIGVCTQRFPCWMYNARAIVYFTFDTNHKLFATAFPQQRKNPQRNNKLPSPPPHPQLHYYLASKPPFTKGDRTTHPTGGGECVSNSTKNTKQGIKNTRRQGESIMLKAIQRERICDECLVETEGREWVGRGWVEEGEGTPPTIQASWS